MNFTIPSYDPTLPATPGLMICGFTKCATSTLHLWLTQHPRIRGGIRKELGYFHDPKSYFFNPQANWRDHGLAGLASLFEDARAGDILIDSTPGYAHHQTALEHIPQLPGPPLCLFVLRDPVMQIISTWRYFSNSRDYIPKDIGLPRFIDMILTGEAAETFPQDHLRDCIGRARFSLVLEKWERALPADRIMVLEMGAMLANPSVAVTCVLDQLGLSFEGYENYAWPSENRSYDVRSTRLRSIAEAARLLLPRDGVLRTVMRDGYRRLITTRPPPTRADYEHTQAIMRLRNALAEEYDALADRGIVFAKR